MQRIKTKETLIICLSVALAISLFALTIGFRSSLHHDPQHISTRPPFSMHAHQNEWTVNVESGKEPLQSPIILNTVETASYPQSSIKLKIFEAKAELLDVGHTFQIRFPSDHPAAEASFEGKNFVLRQIHFHKPSEHLIDGKQYEMEAHFVFMNKNKNALPKALVLGVMILDGAHNKEFAKIWKYLPPYREGYGESKVEISGWIEATHSHELDVDTHAHSEKVLGTDISFDLKGLLPKTADILIYDGSLTTPNCDEGITHAVALSPIFMEHEQVEHFEGYYEGNNRDVQQVGDKTRRNFRRTSIKFN